MKNQEAVALGKRRFKTKGEVKEHYEKYLRTGQKLSGHLRKKFGWAYWKSRDPELLRKIAKEKDQFKKSLKK